MNYLLCFVSFTIVYWIIDKPFFYSDYEINAYNILLAGENENEIIEIITNLIKCKKEDIFEDIDYNTKNKINLIKNNTFEKIEQIIKNDKEFFNLLKNWIIKYWKKKYSF